MPIWKVMSVTEEPQITLEQWKVFELTSELWENPTRHFVGYNRSGREGRVSSAIVEFDPITMVGKTSSGRIYKLVGESGINLDAAYVFNHWSERNRIKTYKEIISLALV